MPRQRAVREISSVVKRFFHTGSHRGKAQLSIVMNFVARTPAVLGILFFIPLMYRELGDAIYGQTMAAVSLGGIASVLLGGGYFLGRRRIGEAMYVDRHDAEADAFTTMMKASVLAATMGVAAAVAYAAWQDWANVFIVIAVIHVFVSFTTAFDEVRTAYNELYVPTAARSLFQILAYTLGLTVAWIAQNPLAAALVLAGPSILASLFSFALLLAKRPYLLKGTGGSAWRALREGVPIGLIDGLVMMAVALSVVLVQSALPPEGGAWYATIVRLWTVMVTLALISVLPLTGYLRGIWNQRTHASQGRISLVWMAISIGFGLGAAIALWLANIVYLGRIMELESPFPPLESLSIYLGLGAVGTFKCFIAFGYIIMNPRAINVNFAAVLLVSIVAAALGQLVEGPETAVHWCALAFAIGTVTAIFRVRARGRDDQGSA